MFWIKVPCSYLKKTTNDLRIFLTPHIFDFSIFFVSKAIFSEHLAICKYPGLNSVRFRRFAKLCALLNHVHCILVTLFVYIKYC